MLKHFTSWCHRATQTLCQCNNCNSMKSTWNVILLHLLIHKGSWECWLASPHNTHVVKGQPNKRLLESSDPFHCEKKSPFTIWYFSISPALSRGSPSLRFFVLMLCDWCIPEMPTCSGCLQYIFPVFTIMYLFTFKKTLFLQHVLTLLSHAHFAVKRNDNFV